MKWLAYFNKSFFENIIYYDLMAGILDCLGKWFLVQSFQIIPTI